MTAPEYATFDRAFGRVLGAFRVKLTTNDRDELARTYFRILEPYDLGEVVEAGRRCIERSKKFPLVADWLLELGGRPSAALSFDVRAMTTLEADELADAERAFYTGPVCTWACCAGVDRPLRFVPTLADNGLEDRALHPRRQRVEVVGHWAHGEELRRWYAAREACFASARSSPRLVRRVLALVAREPGCDDEEG
jgi:hypothetical protein